MNANTSSLNITAVNGKISTFSTGNFDCQGSFNVNSNLINIKKSNTIGILNENPIYTMDIVGDINYTGKLLNNGNVIQTETLSTSLWSQSGTYVFYQGKVMIGSNVQTSYTLYVGGDSYFISNIKCDGTITVSNITSTGTIKAITENVDNLTVNKSATYNCDISMTKNNLVIQNLTGKNITLTGYLDASFGEIKCKSLTVENIENFNSQVTFGENLIVLGKTLLGNDLIINQNKFFINASTGDTSIFGGLLIGNTLRVNGTMTVLNESSLNKLTVNNSLTVNGNITCTGNITLEKSDGLFNTMRVNKETNTKSLYVDSTGDKSEANFIIDGTNTINPVLIKYTNVSDSPASGALVVNGGVGIGGNLNINGYINSLNGSSIFQNLTTNNSIICKGSITTSLDSVFNENLEVGQNLTTVGNIKCSTLDVIGNANFGENIETDTLQTSSNITCGGELYVSGTTTLNQSVVAAGGLLLNNRAIPDEGGVFKILTNYSGSVFTVLGATKLRDIGLPSPTNLPSPTIGINYKIVIGPSYTQPSTPGFYLLLQGTMTGSLRLCGLINNNSVITKIQPNTYKGIKMQFPAPGDVIEISTILISGSSTPTFSDITYHINIIASNSNAYVPTNDGPYPL